MPRIQSGGQPDLKHVSQCSQNIESLDKNTEHEVTFSLYDQYSFSIIPLLGTILAGDRDSYQYLVESIRRFPPQPEFAQMIRNAGFKTGKDIDGAAWVNLWGGITCIHSGVKM